MTQHQQLILQLCTLPIVFYATMVVGIRDEQPFALKGRNELHTEINY